MNAVSRRLSVALAGLALFAFLGAAAAAAQPPAAAPRWWKGNLHTHSLWSDGADYPEMIVDWYKQRGYHFLALSDHNVLAQGQRWIDAQKNRGGAAALESYRKRFGDSWVERRMEDGKAHERLKPLNEYRFLINAVLDQRRRTGQPILPHLNHPNFGWAVTAEDIARLRGKRLFEVYNGHPAVHNHGDAEHPGTERMWDIALT